MANLYVVEHWLGLGLGFGLGLGLGLRLGLGLALTCMSWNIAERQCGANSA